jgi:hypothetical protein
MHRIRSDHDYARLMRRRAQLPLHCGLGLGQLRLGIDPTHFVLLDFESPCRKAHGGGNRHRIGQIELALRIVIPDPLEDCERGVAGERHQPGIAQSDPALVGTGVLLLPDGEERAGRTDDQAAIARRVGGAEPEHGHGCARCQRLAQP